MKPSRKIYVDAHKENVVTECWESVSPHTRKQHSTTGQRLSGSRDRGVPLADNPLLASPNPWGLAPLSPRRLGVRPQQSKLDTVTLRATKAALVRYRPQSKGGVPCYLALKDKINVAQEHM